MDDDSTRVLIPLEELDLCRTTWEAAEALAAQGRWEEGRQLLGRGLEWALEFRGERWGPELLLAWLRLLYRWYRREPKS